MRVIQRPEIFEITQKLTGFIYKDRYFSVTSQITVLVTSAHNYGIIIFSNHWSIVVLITFTVTQWRHMHMYAYIVCGFELLLVIS